MNLNKTKIILVGPDCCGKSTLARHLSNLTGLGVIKGIKGDFKQIEQYENGIFDRIANIDERIYHDSPILTDDVKSLQNGCEIIYINTPLDVLKTRFLERGDEEVTIDDLESIKQNYEKYLFNPSLNISITVLRYDYTHNDIEELISFFRQKASKAVVLSSGGVDSTTCVSLAIKRFGAENVSTVSVFYGQKHVKELRCAEEVAKYYGVKHTTLDLSQIFSFSNNSLMRASTQEIKHTDYSEQVKGGGIINSYVPFRNGVFLSAIASYAMSIYPDDYVAVYLGNHADDAAGNAYADCSVEFSKAMSEAISLGTYGRIKVETPFANLTKKDIVAIGKDLTTPYELTWSCYEGREKACGVCGTCRDRLKAFAENGLKDPIEYEVAYGKDK